MNDLEPWKIWAVTGVLVVAILGVAASRVKPLGSTDAMAQASTLSSNQHDTSAASEPQQLTDQFDAYSVGFSHPAVSRADYSGTQDVSTRVASGTVYVSSALFRPIDEYYQEPELNVGQQLVGDVAPPVDAFASNDEQTPTVFAGEWLEVTNGGINIGDVLDVSSDGQAYSTILDNSDYDQTYSTEPQSLVFLTDPGTGYARVLSTGLDIPAVQVALSAAGADSNGNVLLGGRQVNSAVNDLAMQLSESGDLSMDLDEQTVENLARVQVLTQAQAEYEAVTELTDEAVEQDQPALQQLFSKTLVDLVRTEQEQE